MVCTTKWLVKHNTEVNWDKETIQFTRCLKECKIQYQNIKFTLKTSRIKPIEEIYKWYQEIGKKPNPTNLENLPEYIQPFTYLFNKKKFEKLPERWEWDYKINLIKDTPKKLNAKTYAMTIKKEETLRNIKPMTRQITQDRINCGIKFKIYGTMFHILKKDRSL